MDVEYERTASPAATAYPPVNIGELPDARNAYGKLMSTSSRSLTAECAGTIVVLIDESSQMAAPIAGGTQSKADSAATAVNSMLNQLTTGPNVRLIVVGYGGSDGKEHGAQVRWMGPLAGRVEVNSSELAASPARVEQRIRRIPGPGGVGVSRVEPVRFPIWYVPGRSTGGGIEEAAGFVVRSLAAAGDDSSGKPPLVIHLCARLPAAVSLQDERVRRLAAASLWYHLHLGTNDRIPATAYPSSSLHLANGDVAALFEASSGLAASMVVVLKTARVAVSPGARGIVYQANMRDLIRFLALAKAYIAATPAALAPAEAGKATVTAAAVETTTDPAMTGTLAQPASRPVALILLADRSQADPASRVWLHRQELLNEMIGHIARRGGDDVELGLIVYDGKTAEAGLPGLQAGRATVPAVDLADGALRVEQVTEKVSNGIGGLVSVNRSHPIYVDREPGAPLLDLDPAMMALAELLGRVRRAHEGEEILPLVLHLTGAGISPAAIASAEAHLAAMGGIVLYHAILPESPLPAVAYPAQQDQLADPSAAALWRITSLLAGADRIAATRHHICRESRGLVVGGRFDLLLDSLDALLGKQTCPRTSCSHPLPGTLTAEP